MTDNFLKSGDRVLPVVDMQVRAAKLAQFFSQNGVQPRDSVAIMLRNDFPYTETMTAAGLAGAYAVSVNWHARGDELKYILNDCDAKFLVLHSDMAQECGDAIPQGCTPLVVETPPEIRSAYGMSDARCEIPAGMQRYEDVIESSEPYSGPTHNAPGSMIYTSGTTGNPKGVRRDPATPEQQERTAGVMLNGFFMHPGQRTLMTGPMYHSATNAYSSGTLLLGGDLVLMPRFEAEDMLRLVESEKITHMHMVPTLFVRLLKLPKDVREKYDLSSLKSIVHGAAPCPPEVKKQMIEWWGPIINEYYGSTEAGLVAGCTPQDAIDKPGTVGKLLPDVELDVYDDDGNKLPRGQVGELYAGSRLSADFTYQKKDEARREIDREGLITNGDIGMIDEDGYLFIYDRKRDMIISGGVNIYPAEIEAVLIQHPQVQDIAVFGIPDDEFGETICTHIQTVQGQPLDAGELQAWAGERMAKFKVPKTVVIEKELPREDTGKIFKRKIRQPYWDKAGRTI